MAGDDSLDVTAVVDDANAELRDFIKTVQESIGSGAAGMAEPNDEQLAAFFFKMQGLYPPQPFTYPDGSVVVASPWILSLDPTLGRPVENGKEWLDRFGRFVAKNGGM